MFTCQMRRTNTKDFAIIDEHGDKNFGSKFEEFGTEAFHILRFFLQYSRKKIYTHHAKTALGEGFDIDNTETQCNEKT